MGAILLQPCQAVPATAVKVAALPNLWKPVNGISRHFLARRTSDDPVDDWMKCYGRFRTHNNWDHIIKLANVLFLRGTALNWINKHEDEINSWDALKARFKDIFWKPECRSQHVKNTLSRRVQGTAESRACWIELDRTGSS